MMPDVRTYLVLIVLTATCGSLNTNMWVELAIFLLLVIFELASGRQAYTLKLILLYIIMFAIQYTVFPVAPGWVLTVFSLLVVNMRGFIPVLMCIVMLYKKVQVSRIMATFTKMGLPKSFTVTLAIAIRYIPTVASEWKHISDAMKVRKVSAGIKNPFIILKRKAECFLVPFFTVTLKTVDELSAAAITRGIDNPSVPSCRNYRKMKASDWGIIMTAVLITSFCVYLRYGRHGV